MYTICCWSPSSISNVDPSASLSQLNSSIEIFSQLPVSNVGLTCSSPCFYFSIFLTGFFVTFSGSLWGSSSDKLLVGSQRIIADSTFSFLDIDSLFMVFNSTSILFMPSCFDLSWFSCLALSFPQKMSRFCSD